MAPDPEPPIVGHPAPLFSLTSVQGATVELATYRGRSNVVVWFSRGFTCPFCRVYMDGMTEGYEGLREAGTEIIQVGPNLLQAARTFRSQLAATGATARVGWFVADEDDRRRICGLPPTYTLLEAIQPRRGQVLHYDQYVHPDGYESVSFASMAFYE